MSSATTTSTTRPPCLLQMIASSSCSSSGRAVSRKLVAVCGSSCSAALPRRKATASLASAIQGSARQQRRNASSSSYIPASGPPSIASPPPRRLKPPSPSYYTGRPAYTDLCLRLESLTRRSKRALEQAHVLPPNSALPPSTIAARTNVWLAPTQLSAQVGAPLKAAQYRQLVSRLSILARYRDIVQTHLIDAPDARKEAQDLGSEVVETLEHYMREDAKRGARGDGDRSIRPKSFVDAQGRAYARGRRKESSARVWIIPVKQQAAETSSASPPIAQILLNAQPLSTFFTRSTYHEAVLWPLKLSGLVGAFNVFALVRGGGLTGQAGAVAHGLARAVVAWFEDLASKEGATDEAKERARLVREVLLKDGVLKRDPRMVERKKTGLAKARKAYTYVVRLARDVRHAAPY